MTNHLKRTSSPSGPQGQPQPSRSESSACRRGALPRCAVRYAVQRVSSCFSLPAKEPVCLRHRDRQSGPKAHTQTRNVSAPGMCVAVPPRGALARYVYTAQGRPFCRSRTALRTAPSDQHTMGVCAQRGAMRYMDPPIVYISQANFRPTFSSIHYQFFTLTAISTHQHSP